MRSYRNFTTNRCYHLISRIEHRSFLLEEEKKTRLVEFRYLSSLVASSYEEMTASSHPQSLSQAYRLTVFGRKVVAVSLGLYHRYQFVKAKFDII